VRTTDGVHWRYLGVQHLMRVAFVDVRHGFALERDGIFLRTRDGGARWTSPWGVRLQSLCFSDARTGWVARGGTVWTTHDAGVHWRAKVLLHAPDGNAPYPELACHGSDVWVKVSTGAAAGSEAYAVYRSTDAGRTWTVPFAQFLVPHRPAISAYAGPIVALGDSDAVLEGSCAACGGTGTVTILHGEIRHTFRGVLPGPLAFGDPKTGLVLLTAVRGGGLQVYRTRDGGSTWRRVR
jgi:photosystem II stability/assembly factor-like uncharacterized protein